ncbi:MAG: 50S ribosomal protein L3 [Rhodocyclaceae bacterium]
MALGLVGKKIGMTRVFADDGTSVPVTVLDMSDNRISQIKTPDLDGYSAVQIAIGKRRTSRLGKPLGGHLAKAQVESARSLKEFRVGEADLQSLKLGEPVSVAIFSVGQKVDVTGTTIGKGFSGSIKRHNFSSNRASHGNSVSHNAPGSIGMAQDPGRVFPGKRMAGHLGDVTCTTQNLEVVRIDPDRQLLLVKGAVPGHRGADMIVRPAVKGGAA